MSECWIDNVCYDTEDVLMIFDEHEMYEKKIALLERKGNIADELASVMVGLLNENQFLHYGVKSTQKIEELDQINKELEALKGE